MPTITVYQYQASWKDQESLDDIIALWTGLFNRNTPPDSHSEIKLQTISGKPTMFSCTLRGSSKCSRFADPALILKHSDRWMAYTKEFSSIDAQMMHLRALNIEGLRYFKAGIVIEFLTPFGFISGWIGKKLDQWYCSQAVYYVLTGVKKRISPRRLTKWMRKNGWDIT